MRNACLIGEREAPIKRGAPTTGALPKLILLIYIFIFIPTSFPPLIPCPS